MNPPMKSSFIQILANDGVESSFVFFMKPAENSTCPEVIIVSQTASWMQAAIVLTQVLAMFEPAQPDPDKADLFFKTLEEKEAFIQGLKASR